MIAHTSHDPHPARWAALFADLAGRVDAHERVELDGEVAERARIESGLVRMQDRLGGSVGEVSRIRCRGGVSLVGRVAHVGPDWLLVDEGGRSESIVAARAIVSVANLPRHVRPALGPRMVSERLDLRYALRQVVRDRSSVRIAVDDGAQVSGTLERVGADYVEVSVHPAVDVRRRAEVIEVLALSLDAVVAIRRASS